MRLLVVDFDFFFPNREWDPKEWQFWDWGHSESYKQKFQTDILWSSRAAAFQSAGIDLPGLTGEQTDFWKRFTFRPHVDLFYADSNKYAIIDQVSRDIEEVWLFDAHHDSGYGNRTADEMTVSQSVDCGDWMMAYDLWGVDGHVRYPRWRQEGLPEGESWLDMETPTVELDRRIDDPDEELPRFDRIFVCRSGSWVPPWDGIEDAFWKFLGDAPVQRRRAVDPDGDDIEVRVYDPAIAQGFVEQSEALKSMQGS
jgi:hypothetical protein